MTSVPPGSRQPKELPPPSPGSPLQPSKSRYLIERAPVQAQRAICNLMCFDAHWYLVEWGFWLRGRRSPTLFLIRTTAGAPAGEEIVDQLLIRIFTPAARIVPPIRDSLKEDSGLEACHPTGELALVCLLVKIRTIFTTIHPSCTPASGSCTTMILHWKSQGNICLSEQWSGLTHSKPPTAMGHQVQPTSWATKRRAEKGHARCPVANDRTHTHLVKTVKAMVQRK